MYNNIKKNINDSLFGSDVSVIITILASFIILGIGSTIMFEQVLPNMRTQFSNNIMGIVFGLLFIYLIFKFMGSKTTILGKSVDTGLILYIFIIGGLLILFSG